jgi:5-methylcytosine-specific restriction endonuclease McrA
LASPKFILKLLSEEELKIEIERQRLLKEDREKKYNKEYNKKYWIKNKTRLSECRKEYFKKRWAANKEKFSNAAKDRYQKTKDLTKEIRSKRGKEYYCKNIEKIKNYRNKNKDVQLNYFREHYKNNKEKYAKAAREWAKKNPISIWEYSNARRAKKLNNGGRGVTKKDFERMLISQEGKCAHCKLETKMTLDHIVPLVKGGMHDPDNCQLLCKSCNSSKHTSSMEEFSKRSPISFKPEDDVEY